MNLKKISQKTFTFFFCLSLLAFNWTNAETPSSVKEDEKKGLNADGGVWGFKKSTQVDPRLPRVLLIGDSISIGYKETVIQELQGKAIVDCFFTGLGLGAPEALKKEILKVLAQDSYAVIHFNDQGLHSWQPERVVAGAYEPLFRDYIQTVIQNSKGAKLIWVNTTPLFTPTPRAALGPDNKTIDERNQMASRVLSEIGIPIDDLYSLSVKNMALVRPGDTAHWSPEGKKLQGLQVAKIVLETLNSASAISKQP
ncbi:MAG: SGNH/GDSL hydrolase family protein [Verrucomicrobiota bacterium]